MIKIKSKSQQGGTLSCSIEIGVLGLIVIVLVIGWLLFF
jgi:hypothetical protein